MLTLLWLKGLLARRSGRLLGTVVGVALTVALLATLGTFISASAGAMTQRAIADVPVDWQIQLVPGADPNAVTTALGQSTRFGSIESVGYADVTGLTATSGGTVQTTGAGKVVGISSSYRQHFPSELRPLIGAPVGVLVAQQTAANLHVVPGDQVTINRVGLPPVAVTVDGIVDLPNADSFFQVVGVPTGAAPQAPPDNVLVLPSDRWHQLFDGQATAHPESARTQLHVQISHALPSDPEAAFIEVQQRAHNLEARISGSGLVGDNLAARLDGVRADSLYARVLFLFLGLPGGILAVLLTLAVAASSGERRRREQALLRVRGVPAGQILRLAGAEALVVGMGGVAVGLLLAGITAQLLAPNEPIFDSTTLLGWTVAALVGLVLAILAVATPAWVDARGSTVTAARAEIGRPRQPLWQRAYFDLLFIAAAAVAFWQIASTGYHVVLAPEGVAQSSVAYQAFLTPICLWLGVVLLGIRLAEGGLARGRQPLARLLHPFAGELAGVAAASVGRQRVRVARGIALVALAFSFAASTAVFNTTYNAQSRVDAELTNGADVTIAGSTAAPPSSKLAELRTLPGVTAAQPMQHRFAYVGNDLQDLYGIDPGHIAEATSISNAYFANRDARATLTTLAARPDGVLVSAETAKDYQLQPGDLVNLRLQSAQDHQYRVVPFHFVGVVREFPTAPKDSFLVANARYIVEQTGSDAGEIVLLRTTGDVAGVAAQARSVVGSLPGARVSDLGATQRTISSSLTAVDLRGLTQLELVFAVLLLAGATGLILALGLGERRRAFAILAALGANNRQLGALPWSEGFVVLIGGGILGLLLGFGVAQTLVTLLTGVFDPPPESLAVPWDYLTLLVAAAGAATAAAVIGAQRTARRPPVEALRDL